MASFDKIPIYSGVKVGKLEMIEPVKASEPRVVESRTPFSYIAQGSLWECKCDCGTICYISEYQLERQKVKSCGCIGRSRHASVLFRAERVNKLNQIRAKIKENQSAHAQARRKGNQQEENRLFDLGKLLHAEKKDLEDKK